MRLSQFESYIDRINLVIFSVLAIGTPLAFTSITRSVFEVNKMLVMRYATIALMLCWFFRLIVLAANRIQSTRPSVGWGWLRWEKIGLDLFLLLFFIFNILSTVFSQNVRLSVIGSYDRWEGIIMALNYFFLLVMTVKTMRSRFQVRWLVFFLIVATALSGVYGVFQSLGIDFLTWSADPTFRVFACINNPVHYCAYMAMNVPLCVALLMYVCHRFPGANKWQYKVGMVLFNALIFYAQYLSFSRATWVGFVLAMPFFYLFLFRLIGIHRPRLMVLDALSVLVGLFVFSLYYVFEFHLVAPMVGILFFVLCLMCVGLWALVYRLYEGETTRISLSWVGAVGLVLMALYVGAVYKGEFSGYKQLLWVAFQCGCIAIPLLLTRYFSVSFSRFVLRLFVVMFFFRLQYVVLSLSSVLLEMCLMGGVFYLLFSDQNQDGRDEKRWSFAVMVSFFLVVLLPALPNLLSSLVPASKADKPTELLAMDNVRGRVKGLSVAETGSARVSMWKSAVQWSLDYWLVGSGLDTIKYMYPIYRRSDYGILEGGHNFTPDRLHNEYLNNLTTRGTLATLVYYGGIILGWLLLVLKALPRLSRSPYRFFSLALMTGGLIYLGQVMFNFGVVATLVLFYLCVGASWAISIYPDFESDDSDTNAHVKTPS